MKGTTFVIGVDDNLKIHEVYRKCELTDYSQYQVLHCNINFGLSYRHCRWLSCS